MRRYYVVVLVLAVTLAFPLFSLAQGSALKLDLGSLSSRAKETVNISIDKTTVDWAIQALNSKGGDAAKLRELMKELDGITVQALEFEKDKAPSTEELMAAAQSALKELEGPQWTPIVSATEKHPNGNEIVRVSFRKNTAGEVSGLVILAIEPGEIVLVNISGKVRLDQLESLGKVLGNPKMFGSPTGTR